MGVNRFAPISFNQPTSVYSQAPIDELFRIGAHKQQQQDQSRAQLDLLGKPFNSLQSDRQEAIQERNAADKALQGMYDQDMTSGEGRSKLRSLVKQTQDNYNTGKIGAIQNRFNQYNGIKKDILEDKNSKDWQKELYLKQLDQQFSGKNPNTINYDPETGRYNPIQSPKKFDYVDHQDWINKQIKEVSDDGSYRNFGFSGTPFQFQEAFREGSLDQITRSKLRKTLIERAQGDPMLQDSVQGLSEYHGRGINENQFAQQIPIKNDKGQVVDYDYQLNPNTILGNALHGAIEGKQFRKEKADTKFINDELGLHKAKHKVEQDHIALTSNVERAGLGSSLSSPKDIKNKIEATDEQNQNLINNAKDFRDAKGNKVLFDSQVQMLDMIAKGKANLDITGFHANNEQRDVLLKYLNGINQNNLIKQKTKDFDDRAKTEAGLTKDWKLSPEAEKLGEESYNKQFNYIQQQVLNGLISPQEQQKLAEEARIKTIESQDPAFKKYHDILKKNAENSTETLGVTSFTNKGVEEQLAAILERDVTEQGGLGAKDLKTGKELLPDQYTQIGKIDPQGIGYHFEGDELHLVIRPYQAGDAGKKEGLKTDYIDVKAPQGTEQFVLQSKNITAKQVVANGLLKQAETSPNFTHQILIDDEPLTIRKMTNVDMTKAPKGEEFEIRLGNTVNYYTKDGAIKALTNLDQ